MFTTIALDQKKFILLHSVLINGLFCLLHLNCHYCSFMHNLKLNVNKLICQVNAFVSLKKYLYAFSLSNKNFLSLLPRNIKV